MRWPTTAWRCGRNWPEMWLSRSPAHLALRSRNRPAAGGRALRQSRRGRSDRTARRGSGHAPDLARPPTCTRSVIGSTTSLVLRRISSNQSNRTAPAAPTRMRSFVSDVKNREIETLFIIGANPAYDAPGDLAVADLLGGVQFSAQLSSYRDETAKHCTWHLPATHALESLVGYSCFRWHREHHPAAHPPALRHSLCP